MDVNGLRGLGDVLIDVEAGPDEVRSALCSLLSLPAEEVAVVESYQDLAAYAPEPKAACLLTRLSGGDSPTLLSLFEGITAGMPRIAPAARLCQLLRCCCLVDDGSNNPYTLLLVDAAERCRQVGMDGERWDRDEYVIDRMDPAPGRGRGPSTMPMCHKAYAFDWSAFERNELPGLLSRALETDDPSELLAYVERNRGLLKDPYEGEPLGEDWQESLENRDAHEYGDFALTRFYDPDADWGLAYCWSEIDDALREEDHEVFLGSPLGPGHNRFSPGRYGSYFQRPERVAESLARVRGFDLPWLDEQDRGFLRRFVGLLEECVGAGQGLYVTF